jgi:CRP-like cAMP-binding protein
MFRNHVLNSLNSADLAALTSSLQEVALGAGQLLCDAGDLPDSVYFPSNCVISTVTLLRDGRAFEVSSAGYEGVANLFPILTRSREPRSGCRRRCCGRTSTSTHR